MNLAARLAQRPPWLVRLPSQESTVIAGAGMLIDEWHVITCAHVVGLQLGQGADVAGVGESPITEIVVEFPFAEAMPARQATVVAWQPIEPDRSGDVSVLRLTEPITSTPAPLACPPTLQGHGFSVHGFPDGDLATRQAHGTLGGASGPAGEWVQIESNGVTGWPVGHGFSGAPVFDTETGGIVGIVALRDNHRSAHLLPVSYLRTVWPQLDDLIGWRLDLDPSLRTHWLPRARGSEIEADTGAWYFTGRQVARQAVCDWLETRDQPLLIVTGGPGTGKSALLANLLLAADRMLATTVPTTGPRPRLGAFDIAVHAAGLTCDEVASRIAWAASVEATTTQGLLVALRDR